LYLSTVVEISTQNQKIEGSNFETGTGREKWVRSYLFVTSRSGTVVEKLTHKSKIKGSNPVSCILYLELGERLWLKSYKRLYF
jgi:hypothetical protein